MSAAGVADTAHRVRVTVEIGCMGFQPTNAIVDVLELQGVGETGAHSLADGGDDQAGGGQWLAGRLVIGVVFVGPRPAVDAQNHGPHWAWNKYPLGGASQGSILVSLSLGISFSWYLFLLVSLSVGISFNEAPVPLRLGIMHHADSIPR